MPRVADEVSPPKVGARALRIESTFPHAAADVDQMGHPMLRPHDELGRCEYDTIRPCMAPELRDRRVMLGLPLRMWDADILGQCDDALLIP